MCVDVFLCVSICVCVCLCVCVCVCVCERVCVSVLCDKKINSSRIFFNSKYQIKHSLFYNPINQATIFTFYSGSLFYKNKFHIDIFS